MSIGNVVKPGPEKKTDPKDTWRRHESNPRIEVNGENPPKFRTRQYVPVPVYTAREPR